MKQGQGGHPTEKTPKIRKLKIFAENDTYCHVVLKFSKAYKQICYLAKFQNNYEMITGKYFSDSTRNYTQLIYTIAPSIYIVYATMNTLHFLRNWNHCCHDNLKLHSLVTNTIFSTTEGQIFQGAVSIRKTVLPGMAIPMLKIRRPNGRLIFNMEIAIRR